MLTLVAAVLLLGDHLAPEGGVFPGYDEEAYEEALFKVLLTEPRRELELVSVPRSRPEEAVFVTDAPGGGKRVTSVRTKAGVFRAMNALMKSERPRLEAARDVATAPLSAETYARLVKVWRAALLQLGPAARLRAQDDDATYHFAHWEDGYLSGQVSSPAAGSRMRQLVELGEALTRLARAAPAERAGLEAELAARAEKLLLRLTAASGELL